MKRHIQINPQDNVAVVLDNEGIHAGERVCSENCDIVLADSVAYGHKFALRPIMRGEKVVKYGYPIGIATADIPTGSHVHSHNLKTALEDILEYTYNPHIPEHHSGKPGDGCICVNGYLRKDGRMGIRNELWIIPTVGCVNAQANAIAARLKEKHHSTKGIDDIRAFTHNYGCSQLGSDHENTRAALSALATHPNAGGVLVLGLGCENNQLDSMREAMSPYDSNRVRFLIARDVEDEIEAGVNLCEELIEYMGADVREPLPLSKLRIGLKCGGSDGLSGITANPLAGLFSDWLIGHGGTTVLTEVPEMFGAETILMDRAADEPTFLRIVSLINNFKEYFHSYGQPIYENPSPGNKQGGITTLEEKSLGCIQKGGSMPVVDVLDYGRCINRNGLNLLCAPGNDLVAATALALSGCQMVLFTTGRGTPFGTFVPTLKISTNTTLSVEKKHWIDFNAGTIVEEETPEHALGRLIKQIIDVANGMPTHNEKSGAKEIAIFKTGVTL